MSALAERGDAARRARPRVTAGTVRLLGRGIGYSASPAMHAAAFAALGLTDMRYELADGPAGAVAGELERLRRGDGVGANVTTPHKLLVASLVDELRGDAGPLGSVNTIVVERGGRLVGHNTDLAALIDELRDLCHGAGAPRHPVLLGAGGASGAVAAAVEAIGGARLTQVSRGGAGPLFADLPEVLRDADLLINATPIGTADDTSPVPRELLRPRLVVFDLTYRPSPTRLVREARAAGARARGGARMLLGQGWRSLELWLGVAAPVDAMRAALRRELGDADV